MTPVIPTSSLDIPMPEAARVSPPVCRETRVVRDLRARLHQQARLIDAQADEIAMLRGLLTPPGPRALARLRRSPWWLRLARRVGIAR